MRRHAMRVLTTLMLVGMLGLVPLASPVGVQAQVLLSSAPCASNVTITLTTETVACTLTVAAVRSGQVIHVWAVTMVNMGTAATFLTLRLRRGTTTAGTQIGNTFTLTTSSLQQITAPIAAEDSPGEVAGQPYVLTLQQVAATTNATATFTEMQSFSY